MENLIKLRHLSLAIILATTSAFAETAENKIDNDTQNKALVTAPLLIPSNSEDAEAILGAIAAEAKAQDPNALDIIRDALRNMEENHQQKTKERGWFKETNLRFTPENLTFFIGTGLVTFNSIWIKSHGDPLAMERHILSIKDPIAWISFYSFMVANGFYIDFRTKTMDSATKMQMMKRLSYQGMAVGSLASSFMSDLGHSGKLCIDYWILGHNDEQSVQSCNEAWKSWTARNKFQQYFPQIIAMWASQAVTEFLDASGRKFFQKIPISSRIKNALSGQVLVNYAKKISAFDVAMVYMGGGTWKMKSIRALSKLTQIALFVEVDHLMSPYTYRPLNNLLRPLVFDFDALAINNFVSAADKINWEDKRLPEANKIVCTVHNPNCLENKIVGEIENFTNQMQQWREHLNSDAEMDIAGWMELTKKLLNQVDYSYKFYKSLLSSLFTALNIDSRIQKKELTEEAARKLTRFPFRKLPLYGVSVGNYKAEGMPIEDVYLSRPSEMEEKQLEHIQNVAKEIEKAKEQLEGVSLQKFSSLLERLQSQDLKKIESALIEVNQLLGINSIKASDNSDKIYSKKFKQVLEILRKSLGNPYPIVNEFSGFAQAFSINSTFNTIVPEADFKLWSVSGKYMFSKESDLLTYKLFCGKEKSSLDKLSFKPFNILNEVNVISPQFDPPSVLKSSKELTEFCSSWRKTRELKVFNENLYGQKIGQLSMSDFFIKNFNYSILGDYTNKDNAHNYEKWWIENARKPIDVEFKAFDEKFKDLVQITRENIFDQKKWYNNLVDKLNQSKYLQSNIKENMQFETNFYLQMISRALTKEAVKPLDDKFTFLEKIVANSKNDRFVSVLNLKTFAEVQNVQDLLNAYYPFILQDKVNFDQYIAHSKKIDTAINEILVLGGLKISSKTNPTEVEEDLAPLDLSADDKATTTSTASATGTETSQVAFKDVENLKPNLRQKTIIAAVKGLRAIESEIRRFIRMKVALSQSLELDSKEFMDDFKNTNASQNKMSAPVNANPYGQRH
jgi:hypothetical protein